MHSFDLVVLAELNPDVIVACEPGQVRFGQVEQIVEHAELTLGSSGAITASAAAAQGLRVSLCGVVGDDQVGALTTDMLSARGVDTTPVVRRAGRATGMTLVLSAADGDRAMLTFPGTMADLAAPDIDTDFLAAARHVHVSSIFLQAALQKDLPELLGLARRSGVSTSLDTGWDPAERWTAALPLLPHLDILLPNAAEALHLAEALTGSPAPDAVSAARTLAEAGPCVAVKLGARGAVVVEAGAGRAVAVDADAVDPVDTTGAGDNFDAGFITAFLEGASASDAGARAVSSGSIAVLGHGGTGRLASRDEARAGAAGLAIRPIASGDRLMSSGTE